MFVATTLALEALRACKANRLSWSSLDDCLLATSAPEHYMKVVP